jgi:hypothetical protein
LTQEIQRAEILDWWEAERWRIRQAVEAAHEKYLEKARSSVEDLALKELLLPTSRARKTIERQIESDVNILNRRLASSLKSSFEASVAEVEGASGYAGATLVETATVAASGALAVGSIGIAGAATGLATTTGTFLFVIPTISFSWPVFAAVGVGVTTMAFASPKALRQCRVMVTSRYLRHIEDMLDRVLLADIPDRKRHSTWLTFRSQLDHAAEERLKKIS